MNRKTRIAAVLAAALVSLLLAACSPAGEQAEDSPGGNSVEKTAETIRVGSLKGPTTIGVAAMMDAADGYEFTVAGTADELVPALSRGELDIALLPANLAATLYQKTGGGVRVIDVNTMGVLYAVSADASVSEVSDLAGRKVYMTGKGTVPEYSFKALLSAAGLGEADLALEFRSEPAEVAALIEADSSAVGILPQPYVTAVLAQNQAFHLAFDLSEEWEKASDAAAGSFITGVTVARSELISENPEAAERFLADHAASVQKVNEAPASIASKVVELGIIGNENLAVKSIPACNVVCMTGVQMHEALSGYLAALYAQNPSSVGGTLPDEGFYYLG